MPWDIIDLDINTDPWGTEVARTASVIFPLTIPYQKKKKTERTLNLWLKGKKLGVF